jgi:CheY-like chemotaxis protein
MTTASAASTLGNSWNRLSSKALEPLQGAAFPPVRAPAQLQADDPPRGRILVIADEAALALDLQRMLRDAGFSTVGPASTLVDIQRMIGRSAIDCAVLDLDVDQRTPLPVADLLAFAEVPFVYLSNGSSAMVPTQHRRRPVVVKPVSRGSLLAAVEDAMAKARPAAGGGLLSGAPTPLRWPRVYPPL